MLRHNVFIHEYEWQTYVSIVLLCVTGFGEILISRYPLATPNLIINQKCTLGYIFIIISER